MLAYSTPAQCNCERLSLNNSVGRTGVGRGTSYVDSISKVYTSSTQLCLYDPCAPCSPWDVRACGAHRGGTPSCGTTASISHRAARTGLATPSMRSCGSMGSEAPAGCQALTRGSLAQKNSARLDPTSASRGRASTRRHVSARPPRRRRRHCARASLPSTRGHRPRQRRPTLPRTSAGGLLEHEI